METQVLAQQLERFERDMDWLQKKGVVIIGNEDKQKNLRVIKRRGKKDMAQKKVGRKRGIGVIAIGVEVKNKK